jgi:hypothetical protein
MIGQVRDITVSPALTDGQPSASPGSVTSAAEFPVSAA